MPRTMSNSPKLMPKQLLENSWPMRMATLRATHAQATRSPLATMTRMELSAVTNPMRRMTSTLMKLWVEPLSRRARSQ